MRIAGDICRKHWFALVSGASTRADPWANAQTVDDAIVSLRQARCCSLAQTLRVLVKDLHRAYHSVARLRLDAAHQDIQHRCSGAPDAISCNTLFSFASASCARLRCVMSRKLHTRPTFRCLIS